jgi:hypothetical protein
MIATVRRIDLEPKKSFLGNRVYAHVFLTPRGAPDPEVDLYTDDPSFVAAFLIAWRPAPSPDCVVFPPPIEVGYEEVDGIRRATRVALDYSLV